MRVVIRVRDEKTRRYRRVETYEQMTFLKDAEHLPLQIFDTPVILDSIFADSSLVWLNFTPAWNKKRKHDKEAVGASSSTSEATAGKTATASK